MPILCGGSGVGRALAVRQQCLHCPLGRRQRPLLPAVERLQRIAGEEDGCHALLQGPRRGRWRGGRSSQHC